MPPKRIMFIRHAEKPGEPPCKDDSGVRKDGETDKESLAVRGWVRAGALVRFFATGHDLRPDVIFPAKADGSSHRPKQTVTPLAKLLGLTINDTHAKDELKPLVADLLQQDGTVLVAWEHKVIPKLVRLLHDGKDVPAEWPDARFDMVWMLDRTGDGWTFLQLPQLLLDGDSATPIPLKPNH
jgi:hypothetical protein